jgi:histidine phosphotransfer protein HptB
MDSAQTPIDPEKLDELIDLFGDRDEVKDLFDEFFKEIPQRIESLRTGVASNTAEPINQAAHALKGSSASLGAMQVQDAAFDLEQCARNQEFGPMADHLSRLELELANLRAWLTSQGLLNG